MHSSRLAAIFLLTIGAFAAPALATVTVSVSAPVDGATVGTSFNVAASATTDASGAQVTGWHIYIDSVDQYGTPGPTSSINATVSTTTGAHTMIVRAWDSTGAFGDQTLHLTASYYSSHAAQMASGIESQLWNAGAGSYLPYAGAPGTDWTKWYPDATSQLFPVLHGVIAPGDSRATQLYSHFNSAFPNWPTQIQDPGGFPWVVVADAAALMGDGSRVNTFITTIQNQFVDQGFPWPFYCAEGGWFIRVNSYMLGNRPL